MKKKYLAILRHLRPAPVTLLLLALMLALPSFSWGQTFTETFGTAGPKSVTDAAAAQDFDNDQFGFIGTASLIAEDPFIPPSPASGRSFIYFGDFDSKTGGSAEALPTNERTFTFLRIDNTQLTNIQLSFNLFVDPAFASTTGDFVVEYSTNAGARTPTYTTITTPSLTTQGWRTVTVNNPFNGVQNATLALRFRRKASSGDYIAIDDVRLTGTVAPNFTVSPPDLAFANTAINATSAPQTVAVQGSGLTSGISVVAPTGFLIRQQGIGTYGATVTLAPSSGNVNTAIEVVFNPQTATVFDDQITFNSTGVTQKTVRVTGTGVSPNIVVSPTTLNFPSTAVNSTSAPRSITVEGSNISGSINVVAPTNFLIRQQGVGTYGTSLALTSTNGTVSTVVEVVFNPTTPGSFNGQITFDSNGAARKTVAVSGNTVSPTIVVSPTSLAFGNVEVNTKSGIQSIAVEGSNLSANISVQVPDGYEFRKVGDATFLASGATLTLVQTNGSVNTSVEVRFSPTTTGTFNGNATFFSTGATTQFVAFTGTSVAPAPVITVSTTNPPSPNSNTIVFADTQVGRTSAPASFFVSGQNLDNNTVIVNSPSSEFQIRLGNTGAFTNEIILTGTNGTLASTELQVRFTPTVAGQRNAVISASSGTTVNSILQVSGNALPASTTPEIFITPDPATLDFGTVASNGSAQILTFRVGATMLGSNPLVLTPANATNSNQNIEIRIANQGDFQKEPLIIPSVNGSVTEVTIEVRLVGPLNIGSYSGAITASSPSSGAPNKVVNIIANSNGTSATVSAENTLRSFSTVPGVASAAQSYLVNGQGLIRDITVQAPALFQVALQESDFAALNGATGNTITVVRNNANGDGFTNPVPVFVRYLPTIANAQSDRGSISNTSEPAVGAVIQVEGFSAPSVEIQTPVTPILNVEINTSSAPIAVTIRASRVRQPITVSEVLTNISQFNTPLRDQFQIALTSNGVYGSTVTFTPDANTFSIDQVVYVRYNPTHIGDASAKLQFRSDDFVNTGFQDFPTNGNISGRALDTQPVTRSTIAVVRDGSTATVTFTPAQGNDTNGAGEGRLLIASLRNDLTGGSQPMDGSTYLATNGTFGQGSTLPNNNEYYSVYTGTGDQAVVKGLDPTKSYYFYVFDYNYVATNNIGQRLSVPGAENYLTPTPPNQLVPVAGTVEGTPLPVELTYFTAKLYNNQVNLNWETASEKDNKGFDVERSQDGKLFSAIMFKQGQGSTFSKTQYVAVDEKPLSGVSYYRLKQIDNDGKISLSRVVTITNRAAGEVSMYPNPVQDILNISLPQGITANTQVTITDLSGRVIRTEQLAESGKLNVSNLSSGTYLISVNDGTQQVTRRIVKN